MPMTRYLDLVTEHLQKLHDEERQSVMQAARVVADHVKKDKNVYAYGPGGHSNLGSQQGAMSGINNP